MGFLLAKWVFLRLFFSRNLSFANIDFYSTYYIVTGSFIRLIFLYYRTILGSKNYGNLLLRPFNAKETNPLI